MRKLINIVVIIIIIIVAWFGIRFFFGGSEDTWICDNGEWVKHGVPSAPKPDIPCDGYVLNPSVETKNTTESNDENRYDINVDLPIVKNVDNSEEVNVFIKEKVDEVVNKFKNNIAEGDVPFDFDNEMKSGLWIKYEKHLLNENYLSLRIVISEYFIGAAHPSNYSFALNYNLKDLSEIELSDIFSVNQEKYLARLSDLALIDLVNQSEDLDISLGPGMLKSGTEPKLENFDNFNLSEDGIVFNFDQYQVAPYAAGEFHVMISYEELNDMMLDEFIL